MRAVGADAAYAVHDGLPNDNGLGIYAGMLGERGPGTPTPYTRLTPGESITVRLGTVGRVARTDPRSLTRGSPAGLVATLVTAALVATACSSSGTSHPAANAPAAGRPVLNHNPYRYAAAPGLLWYLLPPPARQPRCRPSCQARLVRPAFRARAIASVDTVAEGHQRWRLIIGLRKPAAAQLARVTRHGRRGSEIVIAVGRQLLVHAPLRRPILGGVWEISGLRLRTATMLANSLRRISAGYPTPHRRHHHRHHVRRKHSSTNRHHRARHRRARHHH